ncbi:MAG: hypothetical protein M3Z85_11900 [Acidobacteriota bacterium]|nr:hypothetical protein [Acidobacteriota bacterium]
MPRGPLSQKSSIAFVSCFPPSTIAGFGVADHAARPRLHPKSTNILEADMVLTLGPRVYLKEWGAREKPAW